MPSHQSRKQVVRVPVKEFITVAFAEDIELAKEYKKMLAKEDIPGLKSTLASATASLNKVTALAEKFGSREERAKLLAENTDDRSYMDETTLEEAFEDGIDEE